jgi:hypothetical protein
MIRRASIRQALILEAPISAAVEAEATPGSNQNSSQVGRSDASHFFFANNLKSFRYELHHMWYCSSAQLARGVNMN